MKKELKKFGIRYSVLGIGNVGATPCTARVGVRLRLQSNQVLRSGCPPRQAETRGFSLLELLAVLVILSALAMIAVVVFANKADEAANRAYDQTKVMLIKQAHAYMLDNTITYPQQDLLPDMIAKGYIKEAVENPYKNKTNFANKKFIVGLTTDGRVAPKLTAGFDGVCNKPDLTEGMTPVKYNGTSWVAADATNTGYDWYKYNGDIKSDNNSGTVAGTYTDDKWANVTLADGSMFVWIPRYTYKIYKDEITPANNRIYIKYSNGLADDTSGSYLVHPAFRLGDTELTGIWAAKFEATAREGLANTYTGSPDDVTTKHVKVIPGVPSWRYIRIGNIFTVCRNMERDTTYGWDGTGIKENSHQMKNTEWGAVAYLAEAIRDGQEIWINNYLYENNGAYAASGDLAAAWWNEPGIEIKTGYAGNSVSAGWSNHIKGNSFSYGTATGQKASTTGNIYGIYDISGGAWEYTSAYMTNGNGLLTGGAASMGNGNVNTYGATLASGTNSMYVDVYPSDPSDNNTTWLDRATDVTAEDHVDINARTVANKNFDLWSNKTGDALYEIVKKAAGDSVAGYSDSSGSAGWKGQTTTAWYSDYTLGNWKNYPFFLRGGNSTDGSAAGAFALYGSYGSPASFRGFRPVVCSLK